MFRIRKFLYFFVLSILFLVSCLDFKILQPTPTLKINTPVSSPTFSINSSFFSFGTPTSSIRDGGLLTGKPCNAPCFFDISIGETLLTQVSPILLTYGIIGSCFQDYNEMYISCDDGLYVSGNLETGLVDGISFYPDVRISVEEVISLYGEPSILQVYPDGIPEAPMVTILLYFDNLNMRVDLETVEGSEYLLENSSQIELITYLDKYTYDELRENMFSQSWEGYARYIPEY